MPTSSGLTVGLQAISIDIKCSVCGTIYGYGREKCPRCYGIVCAECLKPIMRWEDLHRTGTGTIHGRCVDGPRDPEPPIVSPVPIKPVRQSPEIVAWAMLRSTSVE